MWKQTLFLQPWYSLVFNALDDDFIPEIIAAATSPVQQDWLFTQAHSFAKSYIFDDPKLRTEMNALQGPFVCDTCHKEYQLQSALIRHKRKMHDQLEVVESDSSTTEDYMFW